MDPNGFHDLYEYHFAANRRLWEQCINPLTAEQFRCELPYSLGSIRNQVVHMMSVDDRWFSDLRGVEVPDFPDPNRFLTQSAVRDSWDAVEARMRDYLTRLDEEELARPVGEFAAVWQVLYHVLNHGTDHRAQILSMLAQLEVEGFAQDYYLHLIGVF